MGRREAAEARNAVLTALVELGEPSTFDAIATYVTGTDQWDARGEGDRLGVAVRRLVDRGDVVCLWPTMQQWRVLYRLATDEDRAAQEDAAEVRRLMSGWEPAP